MDLNNPENTRCWPVKAIQKKDLIRILLVKSREFSQNTVSQVEPGVKEVLGQEINIRVEVVNEIPKDKSGKLRVAVSNVRIFTNL